MAAKKHHYVPVFYQKGFGDDKGMVWVYDRKEDAYRHLHPKVVCRSEDLYAVRTDNPSPDRRIETDILSPIEGAVAPIIRDLKPESTLLEHERSHLLLFIGLQFTRLPSFGRAVKAVLEATLNDYVIHRFGTIERAEEAVRDMSAKRGAQTIVAASMVDAVMSGAIRMRATEIPFLRAMFEHAMKLAIFLDRCAWSILVAPQNSNFIVCDHPLMTVPQPGMESPEPFGYSTPGVLNYFPLTKRICLRFRLGAGFRYHNVDARIVRAINHNIATHSERFIMAEDRIQLESIVAKAGAKGFDGFERFTVEVLHPEPDRSTFRFSVRPHKYFPLAE